MACVGGRRSALRRPGLFLVGRLFRSRGGSLGGLAFGGLGFEQRGGLFGGAPGGLNEMTAIGHAMGGDDRAIALSHAWRMIIVVFTIPLSFRFFAGYVPPAVIFTGGFAQISALDWSLLIACGSSPFEAGTRVLLHDQCVAVEH